MELERMHHQGQAANGVPRSRRGPPHGANSMEHLNLSLPLHVQVPPLPSPNTTAAAAALFRVNQLPPQTSTPDANSVNASNASAFSFKSPSSVSLKKRQRLMDAHGHGLGIYAPPGTPTAPSQPTPTTAAAAAAAMALSASSPASAASVEQYEQNKRAMMLAASNANNTNNSQNNPATTPTSSDNTGQEMRRRKVGIPKFLRYLFQMLEYEDHAVISWSHDGAAFQIRDPDELAERVLPKYFKHNKVSSFQRQLNYFGFKKWTKTQTNICTFSHPCFHRDEQEKMRLIKRKERSTRGTNNTNNVSKINKSNKMNGTHDDDDVHDDDDDESDDPPAAKAPPAKRAKMTKQPTPTSMPPNKRPSTTSPLASVSTVSNAEPTQTANARRGRGRPPVEKPKKSPKNKASAKSKKSPRESEDEPIATQSLSRKITASPASLRTTPSPTRAMYGGRETPNNDAAPVMPVHSEMLLLQQQQQQTPPFLRRFPNGVYDNNPPPLQDLSEAFGGNGESNWPTSQSNDTYALGGYKFPDPTDYGYAQASNNAPSGHGPSVTSNGVTNPKDYLDVLLESANMDDPQLSAQSNANANGESIQAWDVSYQQQQGGFGRNDDRRIAEEAAMATFNMLSVPSQHQHGQHQQLPSIEDLQGTGRY